MAATTHHVNALIYCSTTAIVRDLRSLFRDRRSPSIHLGDLKVSIYYIKGNLWRKRNLRKGNLRKGNMRKWWSGVSRSSDSPRTYRRSRFLHQSVQVPVSASGKILRHAYNVCGSTDVQSRV